MFAIVLLWTTLVTITFATSIPYHLDSTASGVGSQYNTRTSVSYHYYYKKTSGIYSYHDAITSVPYFRNIIATVIGSAVASNIYSSDFQVTISYTSSGIKYSASNAPLSGSITRSPIRPTGSHTEPMTSYSHFGSLVSPTNISKSTGVTIFPGFPSSKNPISYSHHNASTTVNTATTAIISGPLLGRTSGQTGSMISRTYIASLVSSIDISYPVTTTILPTSTSMKIPVISPVPSHISGSTKQTYSDSILPTKGHYNTICVNPSTECSASQDLFLVTAKPKLNVTDYSHSMLSASETPAHLSRTNGSTTESARKTPNGTPFPTQKQPKESSAGRYNSIEAASPRFYVPGILLFFDFILFVIALS
ncbi:hypothetical protein HI914_06419 [Erysiphe necator]|nr:hypothetical protein HI914_06419 [Erysiphe necator]